MEEYASALYATCNTRMEVMANINIIIFNQSIFQSPPNLFTLHICSRSIVSEQCLSMLYFCIQLMTFTRLSISKSDLFPIIAYTHGQQ